LGKASEGVRGTVPSGLHISIVKDAPGTKETMLLLKDLTKKFDLSPYYFTRKIQIEKFATPHDYPVLTLNTLHQNDPDLLLSAFLHEEIHKFLGGPNQENTRRAIKKLRKILDTCGAEVVEPAENEEHVWERLRDAASLHLTHVSGKKRAIPVLDDAQVPLDKMVAFFKELEALMQTAMIEEFAVWGQAGTGLVHVAPLLDLSAVGDRQKLFKVMEAYYGYVCTIGGFISGEYAEGRMRAIFAHKQFSEHAVSVFRSVKAIFDPQLTMNPGVKMGVTIESLKPLVREEYSLSQQYVHLPRG
jgi:FAD/FMN-containing dehydrogenase